MMKLFKKGPDRSEKKDDRETPVIPAPRDDADSVINIDAGEGDMPREEPRDTSTEEDSRDDDVVPANDPKRRKAG